MTDPARLANEVVERTSALVRIPAPTGREEARAELVGSWWRTDGWRDVRTDGAGNLWARVREGGGPSVLICGHLDTVFEDDVVHEVRAEAGRLFGPSVGDDSVGVAALSAIGTLLAGRGGSPVWIAATVGEEGLGNLRGIRAALGSPPEPVGAVVAIEGNYFGRVSVTGVGALRMRVVLRGPGGHAWERAEAPSAVHEAARVVVALSGLHADGARSTVNVGRIGGGEAINARAREAFFDVDVRADDAQALSRLERAALKAIEGLRAPGMAVEVEQLGRRPTGRIDPSHPLVRAAVAALERAGVTAELVATSTDANAAYEAGIPAVAIGVTVGTGEHTPDEWIEVAPIRDGLLAVADTVTGFEEASG